MDIISLSYKNKLIVELLLSIAFLVANYYAIDTKNKKFSLLRMNIVSCLAYGLYFFAQYKYMLIDDSTDYACSFIMAYSFLINEMRIRFIKHKNN